MNWFSRFISSRGEQREFALRSKRCPTCGVWLVGWTESKWQLDEQGNHSSHSIALKAKCPNCQKLTVAEPWVPDNDNEPLLVLPFASSWVKCPQCGWKFSLEEPTSWSGERHLKCGQRLIIQNGEVC